MAKSYKHKELDVKQRLFEYAVACSKKEDTESQLAAALLFANVADYIAHCLYVLLCDLISESSQFYLGQVYVTIKPRKKVQTLGEITKEIEQFTFPQKNELVGLLKDINGSRTLVMHNIVRSSSESLDKIDKAIVNISEKTTQLVNLFDTLNNQTLPGVKSILDITK